MGHQRHGHLVLQEVSERSTKRQKMHMDPSQPTVQANMADLATSTFTTSHASPTQHAEQHKMMLDPLHGASQPVSQTFIELPHSLETPGDGPLNRDDKKTSTDSSLLPSRSGSTSAMVAETFSVSRRSESSTSTFGEQTESTVPSLIASLAATTSTRYGQVDTQARPTQNRQGGIIGLKSDVNRKLGQSASVQSGIQHCNERVGYTGLEPHDHMCYHPAIEYYFESFSIYKCLPKPERVRWHLHNWEQRNDMDWLCDTTGSKSHNDPLIPLDATYVIVAEDIICEPYYGSAIFFARKDDVNATYRLCVGFYYAYEKSSHYVFSSQKEWADRCCEGIHAVLERHEILRPYGASYLRFARLFRQCGNAINAEFAKRLTGPKLQYHRGPQCRKIYRRKAMVLEQ